MNNKIVFFLLLLPLFLVGCNLNLSEKSLNDSDVVKTSIYNSLALCMWDTLNEINYFEDYSSDSDISQYALIDVNSDGIKDMVWQLQSYKFNYFCIYLLSDEEVIDSSYFNAGGTIEEDTIFLHENDIWEFVYDSSSLWNKAKYHEYIDMKDFSQKLNLFITENYESNEKEYYIIQNDEQRSLSKQECSNYIAKVAKDEGVPLSFTGKINDFETYENLESQIRNILSKS